MGNLSTSEAPQIPLFDLRFEPEDFAAVAETLRSGWLTMGPRTQAFEAAFAAHLGCRHAVAVSSCTAALHLSMLATGIGPGDEVVVPSFTFVATASSVIHCGATPVFADIVSLENPSIDPAHVAALIGPRTKAVVAVHFAGYAAAVDVLRELCDRSGVILIEDAAHAPSSTLANRRLGTWGTAGCFSFFSNKVLSIGEGGLLATDSDEVAECAKQLRSQGMTSGTWDRHTGMSDAYDVVRVGFNYRIDEPRAALLLSRLGRLDSEIDQRRALVRAYRARLAELEGVLVPYRDEEVGESCCYVMPVMLTDPDRRAHVRGVMRDEHGVQTSIFYPAIHEFSAYAPSCSGVSLPRTELAARSEITLPVYPHMTPDEQDIVLAALEDALAR